MSKRLTVGKLDQKDAGRGIARVDREAMNKLGIDAGDIIEIEGKKTAVAKALYGYSQDTGRGIIRIDGATRANASVGIDDRVEVSKTEAKEAEKISLAPAQQNIVIRGAEGLEKHLKSQLVGRPMIKGQRLRIDLPLRVGLLNNSLELVVSSTQPKGAVVISEATEIEWKEEPVATQEEERGVPDISYEDIGGLDDELEQVREMIEVPMRHPELFDRLGIEPPKGVLLRGPPGTGKTLIAKAIANEVDANFISVSGPEIMSKYYGESEEQLREIFEEAEENSPSIIFFDEIDAIAPKRDEISGEVERRVVAQLLSLMDGLEERGDVIVIAATNRPDAVDTALRRAGRLDREVEVGVPDREERLEILQIHSRGMPLSDDVDLEELAENTHGFVGADIEALAKESAMNALRRIRPNIDLEEEEIPPDVLEDLEVTKEDFQEGMTSVEPSAMREVFVDVPDVTYKDVGNLEDAKQKLVEMVEWPLEYPAIFDELETRSPKGILLYGPPGTGKTLLAKAVANASNANFIGIKGPELLSKWVGESEKAVREVFEKARQNAPSVIFFDEIDSVAPERGGSQDSQVTERVVSQLLTELDGIEELENVKVIAASNRPDRLDKALLRAGRIEETIDVSLPDKKAREEIFEVHTRNLPLADEIDIENLAERTEGYTGSDIEALCREASMNSIRDFVESVSPEEFEESVGNVRITLEDFEKALKEIEPSLSDEDMEKYSKIKEQISRRGGTETEEPEKGVL